MRATRPDPSGAGPADRFPSAGEASILVGIETRRRRPGRSGLSEGSIDHECFVARGLPGGDDPVPARPVARPPGDAGPPRRDDRRGRPRPDHARHRRRELLARVLARSCEVLQADRRPRRRPGAGADRASPSTPPPLACRFAADAQKARRRRPDGPAGDGLQVRPPRDDRPLPRRRRGRPTCRSWSTTTRSPTAWTSRPRCSPTWPTSRRWWRSRNRRRTSGGSPT